MVLECEEIACIFLIRSESNSVKWIMKFSLFLQLSSGKASLLAAKILVHCRSQLSSDDDVTSLWSDTSLEWSALGVAAYDVGEFLSRHVSGKKRLH